jgi:diaminopimelate decarboxylase
MTSAARDEARPRREVRPRPAGPPLADHPDADRPDADVPDADSPDADSLDAGPAANGQVAAAGLPAPPADLNALDRTIWPQTARRQDGVLTLGGADVRDLAIEHGTPVFVCDEEDFRGRCRGFRAAFGPGTAVCYAAKAFCCRTVLRWAAQAGLGVDVCTGGEIETALSAGVSAEAITFHGNNKTMEELARALEAGLGHIVLDSFEEIARLGYLAERCGTRPRVLVRVTTGVDASTHEYIATAHDDQKFGFSLAAGVAEEAVRWVLGCRDLDFAGLHSHIGSQVTDVTRFERAAWLMADLAARISDEHGVRIDELNLGGGFAIAYTAGDQLADPAQIARMLTGTVATRCRESGLRPPRLTVEPGRAIAGPGTVTLYEVGPVKAVPYGGGVTHAVGTSPVGGVSPRGGASPRGGLRTYVSVSGGMSDNIRTALYDASYTCVLASREAAAPPMLSRVVGSHCENGDIVVKDTYLPADLAPGDLLAVAATGAYCRSAASNYNQVPRPAVVGVRDGTARVLVRRETLDDLLRLDAG